MGSENSKSERLERTRSPYNYTNQDLYGRKNENSPSNLYPNLNANRPATPVQRVQTPVTPVNTNVNYSRSPNTVDGRTVGTGGFVVVDLNEASARPKPSAPPASELTSPEPSVRNPRSNSRPVTSTSVNTPNNDTRPSRPRGRAADDKFNCPTCSHHLGTTIFQCKSGHGSCKVCQKANRACGKCQEPLTNTRNIMLEGFVAEHLLKNKSPCHNIGCKLRFSDLDMQNHLNECPFGETDCPMGKIFGQCSCRYKIEDMYSHFDAYHKEQISADVGKEMYIFNICMETRKVFLVKIGPYHFLVHVRVSEAARQINMAVQLFGPANSASKWSYEMHVYNKRQPRRKYQYIDTCRSVSTPVQEIFNEAQCAVLPLSHAMTFVNESTLTYKFYIKKIEGNRRARNKGNVDIQNE